MVDLSAARSLDLTRNWDPENAALWEKGGARLASRTLWITTGALTLSFATWFMWSAIVVRLPELGFQLSVGQRFWLAALPGLVGATLRIPYSFMVQIFGTRPVITAATASLLDQVQYYRGRVRCRNVTVCRRGPYGRRCHVERVCRRW